MALNVNLKFSLFGTKYKISSVTRQPVKRKKNKTSRPLNVGKKTSLLVNMQYHNLSTPFNQKAVILKSQESTISNKAEAYQIDSH